MSAGLDSASLRADFPILGRKVNGRRLVYLDNAATSQKPRQVLDAERRYYENTNANIHRGIHTLAEEATQAYESVRAKAAAFVGAPDSRGIVFTRNATEAINLVRYSWARKNLKPGDSIVATRMEHHSNLVPWIQAARETGARLELVPVTQDGALDMEAYHRLLGPRTGLVAVTHVSNVLGTVNPIRKMAEAARRAGAKFLLDAAQSVPHMPVDFGALGCDFLAFSAHKMLGPTGVGVLAASPELLSAMEPFNVGGSMIGEVKGDRASWAKPPRKFEAGTQNIAGVVGLGAAIDYLQGLGMEEVRRHGMELTRYALARLREVPGLVVYGPADPAARGSVVSMTDPEIHPHDLATVLDRHGVAVRAGHHCAQPLMEHLGVPATVRASFYVYNVPEDVDELIGALKAAKEYFASRNA